MLRCEDGRSGDSACARNGPESNTSTQVGGPGSRTKKYGQAETFLIIGMFEGMEPGKD